MIRDWKKFYFGTELLLPKEQNKEEMKGALKNEKEECDKRHFFRIMHLV